MFFYSLLHDCDCKLSILVMGVIKKIHIFFLDLGWDHWTN